MMPQSRPIKCNLQAEKMGKGKGKGVALTQGKRPVCLPACLALPSLPWKMSEKRERKGIVKKYVTIKQAAKHSEIYVFMPLFF